MIKNDANRDQTNPTDELCCQCTADAGCGSSQECVAGTCVARCTSFQESSACPSDRCQWNWKPDGCYDKANSFTNSGTNDGIHTNSQAADAPAGATDALAAATCK